jgi:serine/threonine protein kinase
MNTDTWRKIDECLAEALEMPAAARKSFLATKLGDDREAMREACKLAACADDAERLFATSPVTKYGGPREGSRLGPWELIRPLGSGGMGVVWMARRADGQASMLAAIKLLPPALLRQDADLEQRFLVEKQILARLQHPNIARLLDAGAGSGHETPNFVMEYVEGESLLSYLASHPASLEARLRLFLKLCDAVQYAHGNLAIHRDLKPQNILVQPNGEPKLLDFGIGKILNESAGGGTITLHRAFSIDYASPEQIRGGSIGTSTDIYSLGLILFEIVSGERARQWNGKALGEVLDLSDRFALPAHESISADLMAVLRKATVVDPELRYRTVSELAADVERVLDGRPVEARPAGLLYQWRCFARRNRLAFAASAAGLLSIIGLATWGWISASQAEKDRAVAVEQSRLLQDALTREQSALASEIASRQAADQQRKEAQQQTELARRMGNLAQTREDQAEERLRGMLQIFSNSISSAHREVAKLPGGLKTAIQIIEQTLRQLEDLKPSAAGRPSQVALQAEAHSRLAELYGGDNGNLGQKEKMLVHRRRSAELWSEAHQLQPKRTDWERGWLESRFQLLLANRTLIDSAQTPPEWQDLERGFKDLVARAPNDPLAQRLLGTFYFWRSRRHSGAKPDRVRSDFQSSLNWFQKTLDEKKPTAQALRDVALAHKYLSGTLKGTESLHHASEALRLDRMRSAMDPADAAAKLDVAFSISAMSDVHHINGDQAAAQKGFLEAYRLRKDLAIADPANVFVRGSLAYPLRLFSHVSYVLKDWTSLAEAVKEFEWVAARPSVKIDPLDLVAVAYFKGFLAERAGDRTAACASFGEAARLLSAQQKEFWNAAGVRAAAAGCGSR